MTLNQTIDSDGFESLISKLILDAGLGVPTHLGKGSDRGKDITLATNLNGELYETITIHVECKHSSTGRSISLSDLKTHLRWAEAGWSDLMILATNTRFSASLVDWIEQTKSQRVPILTWDGEFLGAALKGISTGRSTRIRSMIIDQLSSAWRSEKIRRTQTVDARFLAPTSELSFKKPAGFINRKRELEVLLNIERYRYFGLIGSAGMGKSYLVQQVLALAGQEDFTPLLLSTDQLVEDDIAGFLLPLAHVAESRFGDSRLLDHLRSGAGSCQDLTSIISSLLECRSLYIAIEDVHLLEGHTRITSILNGLSLSSESDSRLLLTSRIPELWRGSLLPCDGYLNLEGFTLDDVRRLMRCRGLDLATEDCSKLEEMSAGVPLLLTLTAGHLKSSIKTVAEKIEEAFVHSARRLCEAMLLDLSPNDRTIMFTASVLECEISTIELAAACGLEVEAVGTSLRNLHKYGLLVEDVPLDRAVHREIREVVEASGMSLIGTRLNLARYLKQFTNNPSRVVAAFKLFLGAGDQSSAVELLSIAGYLLVRAGYSSTILKGVADVDPAEVSLTHWLQVVLSKAQAFEHLGEHETALSELRINRPARLANEISYDTETRLQYQEARALYFIADYPECLEIATSLVRTLDEKESYQSRQMKALVLAMIARVHYLRQRWQEARRIYLEALDIQEKLADYPGMNKTVHRLAMVKVQLGDLAGALVDFHRVVQESRRLHDTKRLAYAFHRIGVIHRLRGNLELASKFLEQSLEVKITSGHQRGLVFSWVELGKIAAKLGDWERAEGLAKNALKIVSELSMPKEEAMVASLLSIIRARQGQSADGYRWAERSSSIYRKIGLPERAERAMDKFSENLEKSPEN